MRGMRTLAVLVVAAACVACGATRVPPQQLSGDKNPRIMGIITTDGQTVRFDRQRETITWQSDTLRVVSREATRLFAREQIREVLVDRGAHERLFFFGILPIGAVVLLLITLSQFDNYT